MTSTTDLIRSLATDVKPVRRLRPPVVRALCWELFAVTMLVLIAAGHGVRPDLALKVRQTAFAIGVAAALTTGLLAAMAAFIVSIPGRSRWWLLLPAPALAVWIASIGYGCLTDWVSIGPNGISPGEKVRCFATLAVTGIPLSLLALVMLRHTAYLFPGTVAMTGSLAVAAMTAAALSLFHPLDKIGRAHV